MITVSRMAFYLLAHTYPSSDCIFSIFIIVIIVFILYEVSILNKTLRKLFSSVCATSVKVREIKKLLIHKRRNSDSAMSSCFISDISLNCNCSCNLAGPVNEVWDLIAPFWKCGVPKSGIDNGGGICTCEMTDRFLRFSDLL